MKVFNTNYFSSLVGADRDRYEVKVKLLKGKDPYEINLADTKCDYLHLPDVMYGDIYNYLVHTASYLSSKQMKSYKSLEAHNFFTSGFLQDLRYLRMDDSIVIVLGVVTHSYSLNEAPLKAWVAAKKDGDIITAHCSCMAGIGESCSHVGTVLFALEYATMKRQNSSCTSNSCKWLPPALQDIPCKEISTYYLASSKKKYEEAKSVYIVDIQEKKEVPPIPLRKRTFTSQEKKVKTLQFLAAGGVNSAAMATTPGLCRAYVPKTTITDCTLPKPLSRLFKKENVNLSFEELKDKAEEIFLSLQISDAERWALEIATRDQRKNPLWMNQRAGRITASNMKSACRTDPNDPSVSLLKQICYPGDNKFKSKFAAYGIKNEPVALICYEEKMKKEHKNFNLQKAGLLLHGNYPFIGASPDGVVYCECHGTGLVEVKCAYYKEKNSHGLEDGVLQEDHKNFYQVQTQLLVWNYDYVDFVVWHEELELQIDRIIKNDDFHKVCVAQATKFFRLAVLPELLSKYFTLRKNTPLGENNYEPELTCSCERPASHPMITCENVNCAIKNFHWKCVGVKGKRKSWACSDCQKKMKTKTKRKKNSN